jgi:hypothetical protein
LTTIAVEGFPDFAPTTSASPLVIETASAWPAANASIPPT